MKGQLPFPTPINPARTRRLFSVSLVGTGLGEAVSGGCCSTKLTSLAVAADGTFWVGVEEGNYLASKVRLLHFDGTGALLGNITLDGRVSALADVRSNNNELWVLDGTDPFYRILKLSSDGQLLAQYQVHWGGSALRLMFDDSGNLLLDSWDSYRSPASVAFTATNAFGLQPTQRLEGFQHAGKLYKAWIEPSVPEQPKPIHYVSAGTTQFALMAPSETWDFSILDVLDNGSFYVETHAWGSSFEQTILHFSPDGKLLDAAPVPLTDLYDVIIHKVAVSGDGSVYLLTPDQEVHLLEFGPVTGFSVVPGGPPATTLEAMVGDSLAVAEVQLRPSRPSWGTRAQKADVIKWLTQPPPDTGTVIGLVKNEDEAIALAKDGGHYILFIREPT